MTKRKMKANVTKKGCTVIKRGAETRRNIVGMLNSKTEIGLAEPSGGKLTQGVGKIWVVISFSSSFQFCLFAPDVCIKY